MCWFRWQIIDNISILLSFKHPSDKIPREIYHISSRGVYAGLDDEHIDIKSMLLSFEYNYTNTTNN